VTPLSWLERVPTYKEALDNIKDKDLHTYGFLGYPILQTADIVMYGDPKEELVVPVGEDQAVHVEMGREIVRRFNTYFGLNADMAAMGKDKKAVEHVGYLLPKLGGEDGEHFHEAYRRNIRFAATEWGIENFFEKMEGYRHYFSFEQKLREPQVMLTQAPRIPGTDGRKMSKSYGNFISLSESDESIRTKSRAMITDPARKRRTDPGNPDICPVYDWHKLFSPSETLAWSAAGCRSAGIGCIECKTAMADNLIKWIEPVRARREEYAAHPDKVLQILDNGSVKAREVAQKTMARVREAVFNWKEKRAEVAAPRVVGKS
jgi:tryptophanyl-tRNA synthetase